MSDPKPSEATTGEPSAEAREAARRLPVWMNGETLALVASRLDAFAARAVSAERERLRAMLPPEVFDCGAYYNALDALVADLRVLCPDCFDATGGDDGK